MHRNISKTLAAWTPPKLVQSGVGCEAKMGRPPIGCGLQMGSMAMIEGLYQAMFYADRQHNGLPEEWFGRGVMHIRDGKIIGGDSDFYYIGHYILDGTRFDASLKVTPHTKQPRSGSPFGSKGSDLFVRGTADTVEIRCGGTICDSPGGRIHIGLTWLAQ
ncbi:hypothetical protein P6U16_08840 [Rhizobium sp. 32-5/1]|uniref:hypothetical protein n=1 Tax=Rhizobium sp. 32-5/1 TaxID=3019602 RepID=UPI00240DE1DA|nr:hypothetical protein [Rhizobium sp. 32-5/1]WEZ84659.1 hypothetical protein P6U16_08840 [Rhizobium sp. 32-5/1]